MPVSQDDFLAIAWQLLTPLDPSRPWRGIHSGYNTYFGTKDHWGTVETYANSHNLRQSRWFDVIQNAIHSGRRVSDADAETIREVMEEFGEGEWQHTAIWA